MYAHEVTTEQGAYQPSTIARQTQST